MSNGKKNVPGQLDSNTIDGRQKRKERLCWPQCHENSVGLKAMKNETQNLYSLLLSVSMRCACTEFVVGVVGGCEVVFASFLSSEECLNLLLRPYMLRTQKV